MPIREEDPVRAKEAEIVDCLDDRDTKRRQHRIHRWRDQRKNVVDVSHVRPVPPDHGSERSGGRPVPGCPCKSFESPQGGRTREFCTSPFKQLNRMPGMLQERPFSVHDPAFATTDAIVVMDLQDTHVRLADSQPLQAFVSGRRHKDPSHGDVPLPFASTTLKVFTISSTLLRVRISSSPSEPISRLRSGAIANARLMASVRD